MNVTHITPSTNKSSSRSLTSKPEVSNYKGFIIVDRVTSADLVDPRTFQWMSCPSARSARWTAAVLSRVNTEIQASSSYELHCYRHGDGATWFNCLFQLGQMESKAGAA